MKPEGLLLPERERKLTETPSETSECTTTTSVSGYQGFENREELLQLAALLQIEDADDVHRERFRVDRRKLEHMLLGNYFFIHKSQTQFLNFELLKIKCSIVFSFLNFSCGSLLLIYFYFYYLLKVTMRQQKLLTFSSTRSVFFILFTLLTIFFFFPVESKNG